MAFPVPSETFISNDVKALQSIGVNISVHTLRPMRKDFNRLVKERGLYSLEITHNSIASSFRGLSRGIFKPKILFSLIAFLFSKTWFSPIQLFKSLLLLPRVLDIFFNICKKKPDIVHLSWGHYPCLVGYLVQQWLPEACLSIFLGAYDLVNWHKCTPEVIKKADLVFTHAKVNKSKIFELGAKNIEVVYRGINLNYFQKYKIDIDKKIPKRFITAGRLIPQKGFDDVILAFEKIAERFSDASLVILGDGPELKKLKKLCNDKRLSPFVMFYGHVEHEKVLEEMAKAEIFILMSKYDGERLPNVIKEAIASKCLCVTTQTLGIEELVEHEQHGYIVPQGDYTSAANYLNQILNNPQKINGMRKLAYHHLLCKFDLNVNMMRYRDLWQKCIENKVSADQSIQN
ncbi:glycosyltransferase family 4 protein [Dactylococcopsis salina]|nr:glycosyltransferase family 4 protein [Dactylococcopsis salina]